MINSRAVPVLEDETLQAQSADVDVVSGATYTSEGYQRVPAVRHRRGGAVTRRRARAGAAGRRRAGDGAAGQRAPARPAEVVDAGPVRERRRRPAGDPAQVDAVLSPYRAGSDVRRLAPRRPVGRRRPPVDPRGREPLPRLAVSAPAGLFDAAHGAVDPGRRSAAVGPDRSGEGVGRRPRGAASLRYAAAATAASTGTSARAATSCSVRTPGRTWRLGAAGPRRPGVAS